MTAHTALRLHLLLALGCTDGKEQTTACLGLDEAGEDCPEADEVDPETLSPAICGGEIVSVDGGPIVGECWYGPGGDTAEHPGCVYDVTVRVVESCDYGRPFSSRADAVTRADWARRLHPRLEGVDRAGLAAAWTTIGLAEHASVASFARFTLELLGLGAPAALVRDAQRALSDEIHHAELAFGLASAYAGHPVGPGPLPVGEIRATDLVAMAVACVREGCLAETASALQLAERAAREPDPVVASVLRRLASDERRHAVLAWRAVQWAIGVGGAPVRAAVAEALCATRRDEAWRAVIQPVALAAGMLAA